MNDQEQFYLLKSSALLDWAESWADRSIPGERRCTLCGVERLDGVSGGHLRSCAVGQILEMMVSSDLVSFARTRAPGGNPR
jgi:hypothetical protein